MSYCLFGGAKSTLATPSTSMIPSHWRPSCPPFPLQAGGPTFSKGHRWGPPGQPSAHSSQSVWGLPALLPLAPRTHSRSSPSLEVLMVEPSRAGDGVWGSYCLACGELGWASKPWMRRPGHEILGTDAERVEVRGSPVQQ